MHNNYYCVIVVNPPLGSTLVKMTIRQMALGGCHEVCSAQHRLAFKGFAKEPFGFLL